MTTGQYFLNLALLAWILSSNLGTRTLTRRRITVPLFVVAAAGWFFLDDAPSPCGCAARVAASSPRQAWRMPRYGSP
jgi:hypothetical protein